MATLEDLKKKSAAEITDKLIPAVKLGLEKLVERCYAKGVEIRITSGYRSSAQQQSIYDQGRTKASKAKGEKIVSNAKPGYSMHNYGLAGDFVLTRNGYDLTADSNSNGISDWLEVVTQAKLLGFEWGGDWINFKDRPHIQMAFGLSVSKQLLKGIRPTQAQMDEVIKKIKALEDDSDMANIKELETKIQLQGEAIEAQEKRMVSLEKRVNITGNQAPPEWAHKSLSAAKRAGAITKTTDKSHADLLAIQMNYNLGLYDSGVIQLINLNKEGNK
ncbi:peptidoglycan L-alanyl-D-glutamate endopeptidase CwlK [Paenibacillus sp. DS2015]|uniref:M15 family metallopeptidase n=1 Tax=Paenibacillus sp. DS2015 TaxID=3373917 RepID=UPI003D1EF7CE